MRIQRSMCVCKHTPDTGSYINTMLPGKCIQSLCQRNMMVRPPDFAAASRGLCSSLMHDALCISTSITSEFSPAVTYAISILIYCVTVQAHIVRCWPVHAYTRNTKR